MKSYLVVAVLLLVVVVPKWPAQGKVWISEIMAVNPGGSEGGLQDEDGDRVDWIELWNDGATPVDLAGWHLTNSRQITNQWTFPSFVLAPGSFLVTFASGKNRAVPGLPLHTNFKLDRGGEFLALVRPDGTVAHAFTPHYPAQESGVSYGIVVTNTPAPLVTDLTNVRWLVPNSAGALGTNWTSLAFDDSTSAWQSGMPGVGFDLTGGLASWIGTDLGGAMRGINASALLRMAFQIDLVETEPLASLELRVRSDDGFVAWINGVEVIRRRAPPAGTLPWNATATAENPNPATSEVFDLSTFLPLLRPGTNVLAVHALNVAATDNDFLFQAEMTGQTEARVEERYFAAPTPGHANATTYNGTVAETKLNPDRGFYESPIAVTIETATPGAVIRYTTDGSAPSLVHGQTYSMPLRIDRTTVLRASAFLPGARPANIDTHTYVFVDDVVRQSYSSATNQGFPASILGFPADYAMDPRVIGPGDQFGGKYAATIRDDLKSLPSVSLVMDRDDWFGTNGLFQWPQERGVAWERPVSMEMLYPGEGEVAGNDQVNAGLRVNGNISRNDFNAKHSFRVLFKERYGPGQWHHPIFGTYSNATDRFNTLVLKGGSQDTWSIPFLGERTLYTRDAYLRETVLAMGGLAPHHRNVHVYLNGLYWGIYEFIERPDADFSASYLGGTKDDWAEVQGGFPVTGDTELWNETLRRCQLAPGSNDQYLAIQGLGSDGSPRPGATNYLNIQSLIDFMIAEIYVLNLDWPNNNYWLGREWAAPSGGIRFYPWDGDLSLDLSGSLGSDLTSVTEGVAQPYAAWRQNLEFRVRFGDRLQQHVSAGGALHVDPTSPGWDPAHPERNVPAARFARLADTIRRAIVAESARWGDALRASPMTRDEHWEPHQRFVLTNFFPRRSEILVQQFRASGLYPSISAPIFSHPGGATPAGYAVTLRHTNSIGATILLTLDGSDPRRFGGAVNPAALAYSAPIVINGQTEVKARVRAGTNWSALVTAVFRPPQDLSDLIGSEIMYHPGAPLGLDPDAFEFIELKNAGRRTLELGGLRFSSGISFTFTNGATVGPGEFVTLARDPSAFTARYPGVRLQGVYSGKLANAGDTLRLENALGTLLWTVSYADRAPWPLAADGHGFSLVPALASTPQADPNRAATWRASTFPGGSPGADDPPSPATARPKVVINEVRSASRFPELDAVELFNSETVTVDVSGWFLTDDPWVPAKYRIPPGTIIPAGGFILFDESQFNPQPGSATSFSLRAEGDEIYLLSADSAGQLTGYSHGFQFGATESGTTLGRVVHREGDDELALQLRPTLGTPNAGPRIGPVVINEIHYHPAADDDEFIELRNISSTAVSLSDGPGPDRSWRVNGLGFPFPEGLVLAPGGLLLIVATDPEGFRLTHSVPPGIPILGPYPGALQDDGERLELQRPGPPDLSGGPTVYLDVDVVRYGDRAPWPPTADGAGASLQRKSPTNHANDPAQWEAAAPSPGRLTTDGPAPTITRQPADATTVATGEARFDVGTSGPGPVYFQWTRNGSAIPGATNTSLFLTNLAFGDAGAYRVLVFNDSGSTESQPAMLTVVSGATIISGPTNLAIHIPPDPRAAPGTNATFQVVATSLSPIRYQWRFNGIPIPGATHFTLTITNVQLAHEGSYAVAVTDGNGTAIPPAAYLQPLISPYFLVPPLSQSIAAGRSVTLSAAVAGHPADFTFVWSRGSIRVATNSGHAAASFLTITSSNQPGSETVSVTVRNQANPSPGVPSPAAVITTLSDLDADGLPDEWENRFGLNPSFAGDANLDSDGDGLTNAQEYTAGTDPRLATSTLQTRLRRAGAGVAVEFGAQSNRTYTVEFKDTPEATAWRRLVDLLAQPNSRTETVLDPAPVTERFYRVTTPRQPEPERSPSE